MGANASKKNKLKAKDIQELAEKTKCKSSIQPVAT